MKQVASFVIVSPLANMCVFAQAQAMDKADVITSDVFALIFSIVSLVLAIAALLIGVKTNKKVVGAARREHRAQSFSDPQINSLTRRIQELEDKVTKIAAKPEASVAMEPPMPTAETPQPVPETEMPETPRYPLVRYGVFMAAKHGVLEKYLTPDPGSESTLKIEITSDEAARVSIKENLRMEDLSLLLDSHALEVVEGNPQRYSRIEQCAAGLMELKNHVWTIKQKIQVKLS